MGAVVLAPAHQEPAPEPSVFRLARIDIFWKKRW